MSGLGARVKLAERRVYSLQECARFFSRSPRTVSRWVKQGLLAGFVLPNGLAVDGQSMNDFLAQRRIGGNE